MEILANLLEALVKLTWEFNPIKYSISAQYRAAFHARSGMSVGMTVAAFTVGVLIVAALLTGIFLLLQHGFPRLRL